MFNATRSRSIRMTIRTAIVAGVLTLTAGGGVLAVAEAHAPAKCRVVDTSTYTQTKAVIRDTDTGDRTGTKSRTVTETTEKCRGDIVTTVTHGPWSAPTFAY